MGISVFSICLCVYITTVLSMAAHSFLTLHAAKNDYNNYYEPWMDALTEDELVIAIALMKEIQQVEDTEIDFE